MLRASKAHSRVAEEAGRIGTFEIDIASGVSTVSPEFCRLVGLPILPTVAASVVDGLVHARRRRREIGSANAPGWQRPPRRSSTGSDGRSDAQLRWIARRAAFLRDEGGRVSRMVGTIYDVTERRILQEHQAALLELGDLLRGLSDTSQMAYAAAKIMARILGATRAGYGRVDQDRGSVVLAPGWSEPGVASVIGLHHFGDYGSFLPDLQRGEIVVIPDVASDLRTREKVAALQAMGIRALINVPLIEHEVLVAVLFVHDETARPWTETDVCFVRAVADRTQAAIARMLAEKQQRLLNQELSHRLKNTFAMIQAIAAQTLRKVTERDRRRRVRAADLRSEQRTRRSRAAELGGSRHPRGGGERAQDVRSIGAIRDRWTRDRATLPRDAVAVAHPARARHQRVEIRRPVDRDRNGVAALADRRRGRRRCRAW